MRTSLRALTVAAVCALCSASMLSASLAVESGAIFHHPRVSAGTIHQAGWASSNWSGYAKTGTFTKATGSWVVPGAAPTNQATYSSAWVGIDGFNNGSLIQTGTESDYYSGSAHYSAWWEILPAAETVIPSITVHPGDHMSASITKGTGSTWTISITDTTRNQSFSIQRTYTGPGTSVEWVEEAPTVGGHIATLAHYTSPDTFDPGTANGGNPGLTAANGGVMIQKHRQVSTPSVPDGDTDGFNMAYGSTAPAPPAS
jgi:Peptidase A4 family